MKLSVLIPAYNEEKTLEKVVRKVLTQKINGITNMEIVIVNDASKDNTAQVIDKLAKEFPKSIQGFHQPVNQGKGAALRKGIEVASGDIIIIQDADLEYDPSEFPLVLEPIIEGRADCVYGSRFLSTQSKRVLYFWHMVGNQFLTLLSNMVSNINLSDMETCYKAFRSEIIKSIPIRSNRFGFEPEVTIKIAQRQCRIYEVGISYRGRTYKEGKKIGWKDGVKAIFTIFYFGFQNDHTKK